MMRSLHSGKHKPSSRDHKRSDAIKASDAAERSVACRECNYIHYSDDGYPTSIGSFCSVDCINTFAKQLCMNCRDIHTTDSFDACMNDHIPKCTHHIRKNMFSESYVKHPCTICVKEFISLSSKNEFSCLLCMTNFIGCSCHNCQQKISIQSQQSVCHNCNSQSITTFWTRHVKKDSVHDLQSSTCNLTCENLFGWGNSIHTLRVVSIIPDSLLGEKCFRIKYPNILLIPAISLLDSDEFFSDDQIIRIESEKREQEEADIRRYEWEMDMESYEKNACNEHEHRVYNFYNSHKHLLPEQFRLALDHFATNEKRLYSRESEFCSDDDEYEMLYNDYLNEFYNHDYGADDLANDVDAVDNEAVDDE